ncbi:hypothetical protein KJ807_05660 [Patescibacteria group bacterium]|nr:hypothetical protein [Patescibacteria group bacterium]
MSKGSAATTRRAADALNKTFENLNAETKPTVALANQRGADGEVGNVDYPTSFAHTTDPPLLEKREYAQESLGIPANQLQTTLPITDRDIDIIKQKERLAREKRFQEWLLRKFDLYGDIHTQRWMQEIMPGFFQSREEALEEHLDFQKRVQLLGVRGPKSEEDLRLLFAMDTDPDVQNYVTQLPGARAPDTNATFRRGLFNRKRADRRGQSRGDIGALVDFGPGVPVGDGFAGLPTLRRFAR